MSDDKTQHSVEYAYPDSHASHTHAYLWGPVEKTIKSESNGTPIKIFDLGCGNGAFVKRLAELGHEVTGVDPSTSGIEQAKQGYSGATFHTGSAYDDLHSKFGSFRVVVSLEVVEHLYAPRDFARNLFALVEPGGCAIVTTPFHGYVKNLAIALTGKFDKHFSALWDHGHIKFWSINTLTQLLEEAGFEQIQFHLVGRMPMLAKSMIAVARRPAEKVAS